MTDFLSAIAMCASAALCFFCAGAETGLLNVSGMRVMSLARQGSPKAARLERILARIPTAITVLLVGNNLAAVSFSTISASLSVSAFPGSPVAQTVWALAASLVMLLGCEYVPKLLFTSRPLRRTLAVAPFYEKLEKLLFPATALFTAAARAVFPKREPRRKGALSRSSLRTIVADGKNGAALSGFERKLIDRVLTLQTRTAADLMAPMAGADWAMSDTPLSECVALARRAGHMHLPVFGGDGKTVEGVIDVRDILRRAKGGEPRGTAGSAPRSRPLSIPADMRADDILPLMRRRHMPFAIVRTGSGAAAGVLTEETVLSALVSGLR